MKDFKGEIDIMKKRGLTSTGIKAINRSILLEELRKIKKYIYIWGIKPPSPGDKFAYVSIKLDCGCSVEYHNEECIPYSDSKCGCGNYFIKYHIDTCISDLLIENLKYNFEVK